MMTQPVDLEALAALKDIMEDEFTALVQTYLADAQARVTLLHELLSKQDLDEIRKNAHSLKGSSSNLGASLLTDLCFQVEQQSKDNQLEGLNTLLSQIDEEFVLVKEALENC